MNHIRLSAAGQSSNSHLLADGDTIQLGVDFQGGVEEIFRAVRMKIEIDRPIQSSAYSLATFNQLKSMNTEMEDSVDECCICLYSIAPRQALFIAPCSHHFHYKCIRPLLACHPAFQCPLCRSYADLDASVEIDAPQDIADTHIATTTPQPIPITTATESVDGVVGATFVPDEEERPRETTVSPESDEEQDVLRAAAMTSSPPPATSPLALYHRRQSSSGFVDKLKMVIFDKRRLSVSGGKRRRSHSDDEEDAQNSLDQPIMSTSPSSISAVNEPSTSSSRMTATIPFFGA